jgi:oligosaccharide repeat unit polymerase
LIRSHTKVVGHTDSLPSVPSSTVGVSRHCAYIVQERSRLLHPLFLFLFGWLSVWLLYTLHLSDLLIFSNAAVRDVIVGVVVPFSVTCLIVLMVLALLSLSFPRRDSSEQQYNFDQLDRRVSLLFRVWVILSCMEIVVSGGVPLVWALNGTPKTYFDFGIPSIHGFLNSLIQAIAIIRVAMYLKTRHLRFLLVPLLAILWSVLVLTRNMMIVILLESCVMWLSFNRLRLANVIRLGSAVLLLIFAFGIIGDTRNSNLDIRAVGQATPNFPEWLPSGTLWAYLYVTTPINNLVNTIQSKISRNDPLFPNTTSSLFPSVLRPLIYGSSSREAYEGDLVSNSFNVSTGYIAPFQDYGHSGMLLYGVGIAIVCTVYWRKRSVRDTLIYSVLAQCLVLSTFFNHFFYLPIICQIVWIYLIFSPRRIRLIEGHSDVAKLFLSRYCR